MPIVGRASAMRRSGPAVRVGAWQGGMQADDEHLAGDEQSARARMLLALAGWIVVAAATIGSLLYTSLERFTH